ncbi:MAG: preprotein translocase subunit SecG [Candidatus Omnitrophica bacterium]|nr:preprotein translocase subunit SecG [Candidatus Omnitrophota bacterium]
MLFSLVLVVHILIALFLVGVILLQGGRGGLGETLGGAAAQSLFGGGANAVMTKLTAAAAGLFMGTCLSLAVLSTAKGQSVIDRLPVSPEQLPLSLPQHADRAPIAPSGRSTAKEEPRHPAPATTASAPTTPSTSQPNQTANP